MNCPVCERILAPTLSICPSCGAMMNDTVREELQTKITCGAIQKRQLSEPPQPAKPDSAKPVIKAAPPIRRVDTAELTTAKTSPTLVEFQNKNNVVPEWRLQMQNAVQQRIGSTATAAKMAPIKNEFPVNGAAALQAKPVKRVDQLAEAEISDPRVASALKRINDSRKTYLPPAKAWKKSSHTVPTPMKPYRIVAEQKKVADVSPQAEVLKPTPKLNVLSMPVAAPKRETTELPKLDPKIEKAFEARSEPVIAEKQQPLSITSEAPSIDEPQNEFAGIKSIRIKAETIEIEAVESEEQTDEIEDLAPFSMRFGASLFDMIIGAFVTLLLLSPVAFFGGNWWTTGSLLMFATAWALVLFLYMTVTLGFYGKTAGMRLFSLELVDAVENEYPTLRQAAVNSGLFIATLPFAGAGFLTAFFNDENRALHDLVSGTILVREF